MAAGSSTVADRPTRLQIGAERLQAGQRQHQLVAALAFGQGVDFVDHDALEPFEHARRVFVADQQGKAFGRGQQDMRRVGALAFALRVAGVSPVRSSIRMGRPISSTGVVRLRLMSAASALSGEI